MRPSVFFSLMLLTGLPTMAPACTVPVFRFALENWPAAPFDILVFHSGPLTGEQKKLVHPFDSTNAKISLHDLQKPLPAPIQKVWDKYGKAQGLPCLMVYYPEDARPAPARIAPLTADSVENLLSSPARRELTRRLSQGDSAVWVVLAKKSADATARMLEGEFARLHKEIALPPDDPNFPLQSNIPLRLRFTVLQIDRDDFRETSFVQLLLQSGEGLDKVAGPIVFPIFGRARVLVGLHGKQLAAANIERWASFLCGPCSCRVKELNPGIDLLTSADWNELLDLAETPAKEEKSLAPVTIAPGPPTDNRVAPSPEMPGSLGWLWLVLGGGALLALGSGVRLLFQREQTGVAMTDQASPNTVSTTQQPR